MVEGFSWGMGGIEFFEKIEPAVAAAIAAV